jgi:hypothetical protein
MKIWMSLRTSELSVAIACFRSFSVIGFDAMLRLVQKLEHRQREEEPTTANGAILRVSITVS